jgi:hypothetical protein
MKVSEMISEITAQVLVLPVVGGHDQDVKLLDSSGEVLRLTHVKWDEHSNCWFLVGEWDD